MLSKYDESANNINSIETVVESLMCELGIGGFMGVEDLQPGMKFTVTLEDSSNYHGDIVERTENTLTVSLDNFPPITKTTECELQVTDRQCIVPLEACTDHERLADHYRVPT